MSSSRSSNATVLQRLKKWCRKKATSKPFQAVIGVTEGVSLGTSTLSALERAISLGAPSGLVLRILSGTSYALSGSVALIMSYMTFKYVSVNIKHINQHAEQVRELQSTSDEHEEQIKRLQSLMLLEKEQTLQLLDILSSLPAEDENAEIRQAAFIQMKKDLIKDFKKLQEEAIDKKKSRYEQEEDEDFVVLPTAATSSSHAHHFHHYEPSVTSSPKSSYVPHRFFGARVEQVEPEMIELHKFAKPTKQAVSASARPASPRR